MIKPFAILNVIRIKERNQGMIKEEQILKERFGTENHFSVPDNYFDTFADRLMQQLPEQEVPVVRISLWHRLPLRKIAAVVGVVACMATGTLYIAERTASSHAPHAQVAHVENHEEGDEAATSTEYGTIDEMFDYTMTDNQEIYASLMAGN